MISFIFSLSVFVSAQETDRDIFIKRVEEVRFRSVIDTDSVDRLERILGEDEILDLSSPGGSFLATVRMARIVRQRQARVTTLGECHSGCGIVWVTAVDRYVSGFHEVTFHGTPITALTWMRQHPTWVRPEEMADAERHAAIMTDLLDEAGVQPWLFHCAYRLQNLSHELIGTLDTPSSSRIRTSGGYGRVWFPRSILEAAGVGQLERYDAPNDRQRREVEERRIPFQGPVSIYWAKDGDCDPERIAASQNLAN
jgi:hypothetical protein